MCLERGARRRLLGGRGEEGNGMTHLGGGREGIEVILRGLGMGRNMFGGKHNR